MSRLPSSLAGGASSSSSNNNSSPRSSRPNSAAASRISPRNKANPAADASQTRLNFKPRDLPGSLFSDSASSDPHLEAANAAARTYTINGVQIRFPYSAYPSQISMMDKIIRAAKESQNALLESPTGTGKTVTLLSAILAWRESERTRITNAKIERSNAAFDAAREHRHPHDMPSQLTSPGDPVKKDQEETGFKAFTTTEITHPSDKMIAGLHGAKALVASALGMTYKPTLIPTKNAHPNNDMDGSDDDFISTTGGSSVHIHKRVKASDAHGGHAPATNSSYSSQFTRSTNKSPGDGADAFGQPIPNAPDERPPRIYIASRTQKQIKQMVHELKTKTTYRPRMAILGSREYYCIEPTIKKSNKKNDDCRDALDSNSCGYFSKARNVMAHPSIMGEGNNAIWDIEDLVDAGKRTRGCPYYASRHIAESADVVFAPYNYFVDPLIRSVAAVDLNNSILIIDEAHNIEGNCMEAGSIEVTEADLVDGAKDIEYAMKYGSNPDNYRIIVHMLKGLSSWRKQFGEDFPVREFNRSLRLWSGSDIVRLLEGISIASDTFGCVKQAANTVISESKGSDRNDEKKTVVLHNRTIRTVESLSMVLGFIFDKKHNGEGDYCLIYSKTENPSMGANQPPWVYSFAFWCLNPAVIFRDINAKARSVILTSGTLSPLQTFSSELGVPFTYTLEANHVIKDDQLCVGVLPSGADNVPLTGTFKQAETYDYQDQLGLCIYRLTLIVPEGMLVFFPSYGWLEKLINRWKATGLYRKLAEIKQIFEEPRSAKRGVDALMTDYYSACQNDQGGAIMFCVHRGKMSEGIDFADYRARCVVCVGVPYPHLKDLRVKEKRDYNTRWAASRNMLNGHDWYDIQAYRAINQAIGRCIRHRNDWGAIVLLDHRFTSSRSTASLSKWIRSRTQIWPNLAASEAQLKAFFDYRASDQCNQRSAEQLERDREQLERERAQQAEWQRKRDEEDRIKKEQEKLERSQRLDALRNDIQRQREQQQRLGESSQLKPAVSGNHGSVSQSGLDIARVDVINPVSIGSSLMRKQLNLSKFRYGTSEETVETSASTSDALVDSKSTLTPPTAAPHVPDAVLGLTSSPASMTIAAEEAHANASLHATTSHQAASSSRVATGSQTLNNVNPTPMAPTTGRKNASTQAAIPETATLQCVNCSEMIGFVRFSRIPCPPIRYICERTQSTEILVIDTDHTSSSLPLFSTADHTQSNGDTQSLQLNAHWSSVDAAAFDHACCTRCQCVLAVRVLAATGSSSAHALCGRWVVLADAVGDSMVSDVVV